MKFKTLLFIILAASATSTAFSQSAEQIHKKYQDAITIESFEMLSTLIIYDARGNERQRKLSTANRKFGKTNKTLMRFTAPADVQGTSMLIQNHDDKESDMWIYMPAIRRVRRIAGDDKASNFMGSEFKNSDMSTPNTREFNYKEFGIVKINGKDCYMIEIVPKNADVEDSYGFGKQISYIDKDTYLEQKVEYYDFNGKLHRTKTISDYRKQSDGKYFAFKMEIKNEQNGRRSVMTIDAFQVGSNMPESSFAPAALEN
ncbi:MAG: outer membrane lipoprotein-sorting protein [Ignavibacteriaceae bacterium]